MFLVGIETLLRWQTIGLVFVRPICVSSTGGPMVILRFKVRSKPEGSDELIATLAEIIPTARATEGVISFDIARTLDDPDSFIATAVYDDGAALERQESAAEVHRAMAIFPELLAAPPERTIFDAAIDPELV
jgi:quinol monooxygenase YgiN